MQQKYLLGDKSVITLGGKRKNIDPMQTLQRINMLRDKLMVCVSCFETLIFSQCKTSDS